MSGDVDPGTAALAEAVLALREEVARLAERLGALEAATRPDESPVAAPAAEAAVAPPAEADEAVEQAETAPGEPELTEELVLVISAAIAAFLGKKPYIRQIRLVTSPTWAQVGRVSIQASHALVHQRSGASQ
jgi:methylmalonyl-CoA carboxyltransferase large subunit